MEEQITIEQLIEILEDAKQDYDKFYGRNIKAASTRLRKKIQDVSKLTKVMRKQIIDYKKTIKKKGEI
ncbi:histone H1 [Trichloromonas sp.]|uniref:histone H1 n=1 Tax=Trichloromonas sp. TaxID=3069249 RepID=UPI002A37C7DF|nr:hypothetical protein [Trichloromonas sp.]